MNNPHPTSKLAVISATPWMQLHQALMPDCKRKATVYWWTVVLLGTAALALSAFKVAAMPMGDVVQALAGW